jgi:hypothetical protein
LKKVYKIFKFIIRNTSLACSKIWLEKIGSAELSFALNTDNQKMKCLPRCERQSETATLSFASFPIEATFFQHHDFCLTLYKVSRICSNPMRTRMFEAASAQAGITCKDLLNANNTLNMCDENGEPNATLIQTQPNISNFLFKYAKNNLAVLRVYIKDPYYISIKTDEQMSMISFLGNAGGLLSLCLGISLISLFEIVYHLCNFCTTRIQQKIILNFE